MKYPKYDRFMKKIFLTLISSIALFLGANAQITVVMDVPSDAAPCTGEEVCVDVRVKDFSNVTNMRYNINWDPQVFEFVAVRNFNGQVTDLDAADFDLTEAANGSIMLDWSLFDCNTDNMTGITLDDCNGQCLPSIFQVCLKAINSYGASSEIFVPLTPTPYVTKDNSKCNNVFLNPISDVISTCVRPVTLFATNEFAEEGDQVCVEVKANGFDDLTSMQFTIEWDTTILEFESVIPNSAEVRSLNEGSFGRPSEANVPNNRMTFSWAYVNPSNPGWSLPDSTSLFTVCFRVIGDCETSSPVKFINEAAPFRMEVTNVVEEGFNIYTVSEDGSVTIESCDPGGLVIKADCGDPVNLGDEFCVPVSTEGFTSIRQMSFLSRWNPLVLKFKGISNINGDIPGLDISDFDTSNVANGLVGLAWNTNIPTGASLGGGAGVLYELCFEVVGLGGNSPVQFPRTPARVEQRQNGFIGINPQNCEVVVNQPEGVTFTIDDGSARLNETICVDFSVANFTDIIGMHLNPSWDPTRLEFVSASSTNLTGIDFNTATGPAGFISLDYNSAVPSSLSDGDVAFTLCFKVIADPGDCDIITIENFPDNSETVTVMAPATPQPVTEEHYQGGEVCSLFPEGFLLKIDTVSGDWLDSVCLDFKVISFDNIQEAAFSFNWDPTAIDFQKIELTGDWPGLTEANFNTSSASVGSISIDWASGTPTAIPDETTVFRICYALNGAADECYPVTVSESPAPVVTTDQGDGSLLSDGGAVCIDDRLIVTGVEITPTSCPDASDGSIKLSVIGGREPVGFNWEIGDLTRFGPEVDNLPAGIIPVTIFDNSRPNSIVLRDTFEIPVTDMIPFADAGLDQTFNCDEGSVAVQGTGSPENEGYSVNWRTIGGFLPVTTDQYLLLAQGPGDYILEVTRDETGCTVRDTMTIVNPPAPTADAGTDSAFDCGDNNEFVVLDGSGSTQGDSISYQWTSLRNAEIAAGEDTLISSRALTDGVFILRVTNLNTGCFDTDTVSVTDTRVFPEAVGGNIYELACDGTPVTLDGSNSNNANPVSYQWSDSNGQTISSQITAIVTDTGSYVLRVTDNATSCFREDTVQVIPTTSFPIISGSDPVPEFSCNSDTVSLEATVSGAFNISVQWTPLDPSASIVAGLDDTLATRVLGPGRYELTVLNNINRCVTTDTLEVTDLTIPPAVDAGDDASVTCTNTSANLSGSVEGTNVVTAWTRSGAVLAENMLAITVEGPGTYILMATDTITGCVGLDSVMVLNDGSLPTVSITGPSEFDCGVGVANLSASISPAADYDIRWEAVEGIGKIIDGFTSPNAVVDGPGTFQINVTNLATGCSGGDLIVITGDTVKPIVDAGMDLAITCEADTLSLMGSIMGGGDSITHSWIALNGTIIPGSEDGTSIMVATPGTYLFRATNPDNGCFTVDTVNVSENLTLPISEAGPSSELTCEINSFTLDGTGSSANGPYSYLWIQDGRIVAEDTLQHTVGAPGTYYLAVRDTINGCVASDSTVITITDELPEIRFISQVDNITCLRDTVTIMPDILPESTDYIISWEAIDGGNIVSGANTLTPVVNQAGTYKITVSNPVTGCVGENQIIIEEDLLPPVANAGADMSIDCQVDSVKLTGSGSNGPTYRYKWTALDGGMISGPDSTLEVLVRQAGRYEFMVTDLFNGCTAVDEVEVLNNASVPVINLPATASLDCTNPTLSLDASQSVVGADVSITWTGVDGGTTTPTDNDLIVEVTTAGRFELYIVDNVSGCDARDTIEVMQNQVLPVANAGSDFSVSCSTGGIPLNGAGSSTGDTIVYAWSVVQGSGAITDGSTLTPTVSSVGVYELVVTNTSNGCTASDMVTISLDNNLPLADAGPDDATCDNSATLSAVPATGAQGIWSGPTGILIDMPNNSTTFASNLTPGQNAFVWTLSSEECPNYSSDTMFVNVAIPPVANDDGATVELPDSVQTINVLSNDQFTGNVTVAILSQPGQGSLTPAGQDGVYTYQIPSGAASGQDNFTYQICSVECPDLCSTGTVNITIEDDSGPVTEDPDKLQNAITPNGDGMNETLIFDVLQDGKDFPNNEIIIFNRWGDIVYQASPYVNNWDGKNQSGQDLPDGTYYYILRLDIGEGEILKGDVTILK